MSSFAVDLQEQQEKAQLKQRDEFWSGHSRYQIPMRILGYKGQNESLVLAYLYERASSISFYSAEAVLIEIKIKEQTIAKKTGISQAAVSKAIRSLEADRAIRVHRHQDSVTKRTKTSVYVPLHSETAEPLTCSPSTYGVCHQNFDRPYITAVKETREKLLQMSPAGRQVYLSALAMASVRVHTSFGVNRDDWKTKTLLGRNSFNRGLQQCVTDGLLSYRRYTLTLNDPRTKKPSDRVVARIEHENPRWKFDLNAVTADEWHKVCEALLKRKFIVGESGWSYSTRESTCPLCAEERGFRVNFAEKNFQCHKCARFGKLGQLVQRVLRVTKMSEAKDYIKSVIAQQQAVAA